MRCPYCSVDDDRVIDSRLTDDGTAIRRRRQCNACGKRSTTYERVENEEQIRVVKSDERIQLLDRKKIIKGLMTACEKRPVKVEKIEAIVNRIIQDFQAEGLREVTSSLIGNKVMEALRDLDQIAYVRFASVYRQFKDIDEFMSELRTIVTEKSGRGD